MITFAVLTLSDKGSLGEREDLSGPAIAELLKGIGEMKHYAILPDDKDLIKERLLRYTGKVDLILGGRVGGGLVEVLEDDGLDLVGLFGLAHGLGDESARGNARPVAGEHGSPDGGDGDKIRESVQSCLRYPPPVVGTARETETADWILKFS